MKKNEQVSEEERTGELGREHVSEEEDTGKGGRENMWVK